MGIPIIQGRDFTPYDTETSHRVAIVNLEFVRQLIGSGTVIGQRLTTGAEPRYPSTVYEIVGVIPDTQYNDLRGTRPPMVFAPDSQHPVLDRPGAAILIHSSVPPETAITTVRLYMRGAHPGMVTEFSVFQSSIRDGLVRERLLAMLSGFFGVLAVVLAIVGLYGMLSYAVLRRRPEIGVRLALGASRRQVMGLVMREAGWLLVIGVAAGVLVSLLAGRSASTLLFGVTPQDPLTLTGACVLLGVIAAAASFLPARRASRIDPAQMLRE
jgi:ABC-type antimicrobial peptide transport system permease subunit